MEGLHRYLQGESVDLGKASHYKMAVLQTLKELRIDESAEEMFRRSMVLCEKHHIQLPVGPLMSLLWYQPVDQTRA